MKNGQADTSRSVAQTSGDVSIGLSFAIAFHGYDDISLFVSRFDIAVGLGNLFQWITSIDDCSYLACLNKPPEEY